MPAERTESAPAGGRDVADEALRPADDAVLAALAASQRDFLRFLARRLDSRDDAEDALQEVWLKVVQGGATLDSGGNIEAWLRRVVRNVLTDHYRRRAARNRLGEALRQAPVPADGDEELEAAICACLHRLLPTLRPEYADLLWRVDLAGQPRDSVARQLGLTPNNLSVRLHRARQALRRRLLQTCETCPTHGFRNCACPGHARRQHATGASVRSELAARLESESQAEAAPRLSGGMQ